MPPRPDVSALPAATIEADGFRVTFFRAGDRYAHRIEVFDAGQGSWQPVLESVEGAADEAWPASPPLQHLHMEKRAEGPVALLVGMAGRTHWSAAVEVGGEPDGQRVIRFDVAARVHGAGNAPSGDVRPWLGSTYHRLSAERPGMLPLRALDGAELVPPDESGEDRSAVRPGGLPQEGQAAARTITWRYSIESS
jgi:hypothetical protein